MVFLIPLQQLKTPYSLVCSDLISRGIDISHVSHVVSYDAPVDIRKYVHRVGRTARAGRTGDAWTLVEEQEVCLLISAFRVVTQDSLQARYFKNLLRDADHLAKVKRLRVSEKDVEPLMSDYQVRLLNIVLCLPQCSYLISDRFVPVEGGLHQMKKKPLCSIGRV
jgi:ATP-dependent RNA helicase DDX51/DBP6